MIRALRTALELFSIPDFRGGTWRVLRHRWTVASNNLAGEVLLLFVEPALTLVALAYGLGQWVNEIDGKPYAVYIVPAIAAVTAMFIPYWETAYGVYSRLRSAHGYWAALQSPIDTVDLATGEILWATIKGTVAGAALLLLGWCMGWCPSPWFLMALLALVPGAMLFAAVGLWSAASAHRSMSLLMIQSLILGPLALWSDTVFPFGRLGVVAAALTWASPLTHVVRPLRTLCSGEVNSLVFLDLAIIWLVASITANWAVLKFSRRLIPR